MPIFSNCFARRFSETASCLAFLKTVGRFKTETHNMEHNNFWNADPWSPEMLPKGLRTAGRRSDFCFGSIPTSEAIAGSAELSSL
jgi:hypothetical protein